MEGIVLIQPNPVTAWKGTTVKSTVAPNASGSGFCDSGGGLAATLITSPLATVSGTVNVAASTFVGRGYMTDRVEFYVDGKLKATSRTSPYGFQWDTTSAPNGLHTLMVVGVGTEGGTTSHAVTVMVNNAVNH
jgi:hypothetical protein